MYERGMITAVDFQIRLVELMLEAGDDGVCLELCSNLPEALRREFWTWLVNLDVMDYYCRTFAIGDVKSSDQIHAEAAERQGLLRRLAPRLRSVLQHSTSKPV